MLSDTNISRETRNAFSQSEELSRADIFLFLTTACQGVRLIRKQNLDTTCGPIDIAWNRYLGHGFDVEVPRLSGVIVKSHAATWTSTAAGTYVAHSWRDVPKAARDSPSFRPLQCLVSVAGNVHAYCYQPQKGDPVPE